MYDEDDSEDSPKVYTDLYLDGDVYSFTYYKFLNNDNPEYLSQLMMKCFMAILVQLLITYVKVSDKYKNCAPVFRGDATLNCTRLVCCFLMHFMMYPEIDKSIRMIQFMTRNHKEFCQGSIFFPTILCILKGGGSLIVEFFTIYLLIRYETIS